MSDAEIEDATPASVVSHTRRRADKADIVGMFYNVKPEVILGGGSAYFLPKETAGSKRKDSINYIQKFGDAGYKLVTNRTEMLSAVSGQTPTACSASFTPATWTAGSTATSGRATPSRSSRTSLI